MGETVGQYPSKDHLLYLFTSIYADYYCNTTHRSLLLFIEYYSLQVYGGKPDHDEIIDGCSIATPYVNGAHMANWGFCAMVSCRHR